MIGEYKTYLVLFLLSAGCSWLVVPWSIRLAHRWKAVDVPGGRRIHTRPTPRLGGIAVFVGFFLPWLGLYVIDNPISSTFRNFETFMLGMFVGASSMLILGIFDDVRGANAAKKFAVQLGTACVLWILGIRIHEFSNPWGQAFALGWWSLPVTVFWLVGITNAINLLDGIDGLVAGVTVVLCLCLAIINILSHHVLLALLTICLGGAALGFLPYNRTPARTFLGDSGSLTIGMVLACISVMSFFEAGQHKASPIFSVPLVLFSLPLLDTLRVMVRRALSGKPVFQADKSHVHHRLLSMGLNTRQTAWTLYGVTLATGVIAIVMTRLKSSDQLLWSLLCIGVAVVIYTIWTLRIRPRFSNGNPK